MTEELFLDKLNSIDYSVDHSKEEIIEEVTKHALDHSYRVADTNTEKPWGAYLRFEYDDAGRFVEEFFPEIDSSEARLGNDEGSLSPKILLVYPGERLGWQYQDHRAKYWKFLTPGKYFASDNDKTGDAQLAVVGSTLQLAQGQRHRLVGMPGAYVLVAEIRQHTDPDESSDEDNITSLQDDYAR